MILNKISNDPDDIRYIRWGSLEMNRVWLENFKDMLDTDMILPLLYNSTTVKTIRILR